MVLLMLRRQFYLSYCCFFCSSSSLEDPHSPKVIYTEPGIVSIGIKKGTFLAGIPMDLWDSSWISIFAYGVTELVL